MLSEVINHLHPIVVHFPIAMITIALIYDLFNAIKYKSISPSTGIWLWLVAAAGSWASVATGPENDARGNTNFMELHETLADFTAWAVTILVVVRLVMLWKNKKPFAKGFLVAYLILALLSCGLVLGTGYYGGKMVYNDGVGVSVDGTPVNPPVQRRSH